jgi:hypothetical protein
MYSSTTSVTYLYKIIQEAITDTNPKQEKAHLKYENFN